MKKQWLIPGVLALPLLVGAALGSTLAKGKKVSNWQPEADPEREEAYAKKLSTMVQYETVSRMDEIQREKFLGFHKVLEELFPLLHQNLEKTEIDGSLLYLWKGRHSDKPVILMGHQDVVPAEGKWEHEPFSGDIENGKIWGRGSSDDKCSVMAFMQAVEELLKEGFVPEQDIYLASSSGEEVDGPGARKIVEELERRGVKPFLVCDEGGAIVTEPIGGIKGNFAMVGVLEKGMGNLTVSAYSNGGHSSYPKKNSPIARLSKFVADIEKHDPMTVEFEPETEAMFKALSGYGPFYMRLLFGNLWLFKPLLKVLLPKISPQAGALLKTTIAFTQQSGSDGANVMPQEATLNINLRYIPHQGKEESDRIIEEIAKKYDLVISKNTGYDALEPVSTKSEAYHLVEEVIHETFPGLPVCPYVMTGGTDARNYQKICDACIRFSPVLFGPAQMKGMHGLNEYLDTVSLPGAVDFYKGVIRKIR